MELLLRPFTSADFEVLFQIDQACFPRGVAYSRATLRHFLGLPGARCLVATDGSKIIGFVLSAAEIVQGQIITLDVLASHRRQGVGSRLLQAAEEMLLAGGIECIRLETATDNASAVAFWQKHGYRAFGTAKGYYGRGRDAYLMHKHFGHTKEIGPV